MVEVRVKAGDTIYVGQSGGKSTSIPMVATRTEVKPNVLLNAAKPPGISPALMMHRPSLRVIFRLANRKPE
jgi:hypothetical protein